MILEGSDSVDEAAVMVIQTEFYRKRSISSSQWSSFLTATTLDLPTPPVDLIPIPECNYDNAIHAILEEHSPSPTAYSRCSPDNSRRSSPILHTSRPCDLPDVSPRASPVPSCRSTRFPSTSARRQFRCHSPPPPPPPPPTQRYRSLLDDYHEDPDEVLGPLPKNYDRNQDPIIKENTEMNEKIAELTADLIDQPSESSRAPRTRIPVVRFGEVVIKSKSGEWDAPLLPAHEGLGIAVRLLEILENTLARLRLTTPRPKLADQVVPRKSFTGSNCPRKASVGEKCILKNRAGNQSPTRTGPVDMSPAGSSTTGKTTKSTSTAAPPQPKEPLTDPADISRPNSLPPPSDEGLPPTLPLVEPRSIQTPPPVDPSDSSRRTLPAKPPPQSPPTATRMEHFRTQAHRLRRCRQFKILRRGDE